jgi:TetR/AcrR family transcriptional regulator, transcriptional repressor for nem operon
MHTDFRADGPGNHTLEPIRRQRPRTAAGRARPASADGRGFRQKANQHAVNPPLCCELSRGFAALIDSIPTDRYVFCVPDHNNEPKRAGARTRQKLLDASFVLFREKGYSATSIDELCTKAEVTKGAFFHHFRSKDALAVAAVDRWSEVSRTLFLTAPYHKHRDPLDRVLAYLDFRKALLNGEIAQFSCLVGTMVQEVYGTHAEIREACEASLSGHAAMVEADISAAMKLYGVRTKWSAQTLALHAQVVPQGAFILAKATRRADVAASSIDHLRCYIALLFKTGTSKKRRLEDTDPNHPKCTEK